MYYILNKDIALRSWWKVPYAYYSWHQEYAKSFTKEEFELLLLCDGSHDLQDSDLLKQLLDKRIINECAKGTKLNPWQEHKSYNNRYMPLMSLQITGRCNYNCLHCFNAKDNERLQSELTYEQLIDILDQAKDCGINGITITGGEPLVHKDFLKIIDAIYERDMYVFDLNTNGYFLTQEMLDHFKEIECYPLIKISFDGIGYHDWMRNKVGAQQEALKAIKLAVDNDFKVMAQIQINRKNKDSILETLNLLDDMGVDKARIVKTTETPRWVENADGMSLSVTEYYDECYKIIEEYKKNKHNMTIVMWQLLEYSPKSKHYNLKTDLLGNNKYRDNIPICKGNRGMMSIGANGRLYPCFQLSGLLEAHDEVLGNIHEQPMRKLLQESKYLDTIELSVKDRYDHNDKCKKCEHFYKCLGGCPALGYINTDGDILGIDNWKCDFYENGYEEKFKKLLETE